MLLPKARGIVLSDEEFHDLGLLCLYAAAPERWAARAPRASKHWLAGTMLGRHSSCHLNRRGVLANQPRPHLCRFPATFRSDQSDLSCPLASALNFLRAARLPSEQCVAGARPRWTATRQLHRCVDRRATWHLVRSRARRRTLATLHPALPALPRWQCRPSLRWLTGSACHAPPTPRCRGRTAACASGADGRTSTAQVRRLHLCTLARCMVRTAAPAVHKRQVHRRDSASWAHRSQIQ